MLLIPILVRLLLMKRDFRNLLSFHEFSQFLQINVGDKKLEMGALTVFALR